MPKDVIVLSPTQRDAISTKLSATIQTTQRDKTILFIGMVSICYDTQIMIQYRQVGWVKSVSTHKQKCHCIGWHPTSLWGGIKFLTKWHHTKEYFLFLLCSSPHTLNDITCVSKFQKTTPPIGKCGTKTSAEIETRNRDEYCVFFHVLCV